MTHLNSIFAGQPLLRVLVLEDEERSPVLVKGQAAHRRHGQRRSQGDRGDLKRFKVGGRRDFLHPVCLTGEY